jgi:hypothetical protein
MRWDSAVAQPWSIGMGWERELIGEAHALAMGEREGADIDFYRKNSKGFDFRI